MKFIKRYIWWVILGAALYCLLSFHFVIVGKSVKLLKKSNLSLNYTFFSVSGKRNEAILAIDELRRDGIGELLVKTGRMSDAELERLMSKYEEED